jgi:hypothetical protein
MDNESVNTSLTNGQNRSSSMKLVLKYLNLLTKKSNKTSVTIFKLHEIREQWLPSSSSTTKAITIFPSKPWRISFIDQLKQTAVSIV